MPNIQDIDRLICNVLRGIRLWDARAQRLVLNTGAAESGYEHLYQIGDGPACSYWQIEPVTAYDNCKNWLIHRPNTLYRIAKALHLNVGLLQYPNLHIMKELLTQHLGFAIAMCRTKYRRVPLPLPEVGDLIGQAEYHEKWYNTTDNAKPGLEDDIQHFVDAHNRIVKGKV